MNEANGIKCDVEFQMKVTKERAKVVEMKPHDFESGKPKQQ